MKAISPLIATILLIAFTIGVGGLVSIFITGLTTTSTGVTSNQSEALTKCAGAWMSVYSVTSTKILVTNPNSQAITGIDYISGDGYIVTDNITSLSPGASGSMLWTAGTNTSVTVRGQCQSIVSVEGKCTNAQDCWDV